jgi:hypothetical protein
MRATGDIKVPSGVDENGNAVFKSLDTMMDELKAERDAADHLTACALPQKEAAA